MLEAVADYGVVKVPSVSISNHLWYLNAGLSAPPLVMVHDMDNGRIQKPQKRVSVDLPTSKEVLTPVKD